MKVFAAVTALIWGAPAADHHVGGRVDPWSMSLRLEGGYLPNSGLLQVNFLNGSSNTSWGGVCLDQFSFDDASAACHSLGYWDSTPEVGAFRKFTPSAYLSHVWCPAHSFLQNCTFNNSYPWMQPCKENLLVYLTCHPRIGPKPTTPGPSPPPSPSGNKTIAIVVCNDPFCSNSTCKVDSVVPQESCFRIGNNQSQLARCMKRPGQRCARVSFYNGTCAPGNNIFAQPITCDQCSADPYGAFGRITGCSVNASFVSYQYGCDSRCMNCNSFKRFDRNTCVPLADQLMSFTQSESCEEQIAFRTFSDSRCMNASTPLQLVTAERCLGQPGYGVRYLCQGGSSFSSAARRSSRRGLRGNRV